VTYQSLDGFRRFTFLVVISAALSSLAACGGSGNGAGRVVASVQSIQISPANPEAAIGQTLQLKATASYSDGSRGDVTGQVSWSSSNSTVATTTSNGQVAAMSAGIAAIHASLSGVNAATQLMVGGSGGGLPRGYAYIASADAQRRQVPGVVYQYTIGPDGSLTPMSVASTPAGVTPTAMVSDPTAHYVYAVNLGDDTISQYAVGAGGVLMALSPPAVSVTGPFPYAAGYSVSVDPSGRFLYVVTMPQDPPGLSASIAQYSIGSDGTLTPLVPAYVSVPASASGPLAIDPSGQHAYLAGATSAPGGQVSQFSIGADGTLAQLAPATVLATRAAIGVTIAPSGQTAYVLSTCVDNACDGQVAQYTIGANGVLTSTGAITLTGSHVNPVAMVTDGTGSSAYLLTNFMGVDTNTGAVYQYAIDSTDALVSDTPTSLGVASGYVAESTYGPHLYALSANAVGFASGSPAGGHVDHYAIGSGGLLAAVSTTPVVASLPTAMALVAAH
jgi:6-phosphogluconolactonase (cycloisomerase 2 family)